MKKTNKKNHPVVELKNISKLFSQQNNKTFKELIPALFKQKELKKQFWALKNIKFKINKGERVGIIGPNGSGKSTLLKLIAGVSQPSKGSIKIKGKIAPLIELGAGFHPELTGRENVFLNGVILGLKRQEIKLIFDDIVDFAEIQEFIDQPVKHYSSGMYLRLAFSIAVHTKPDILLVDEILAVGDQNFQDKCLQRIDRMVKKDKVTLIVVSHERALIEKVCQRAIFIYKGKILSQGYPKKVFDKYVSTIFKSQDSQAFQNLSASEHKFLKGESLVSVEKELEPKSKPKERDDVVQAQPQQPESKTELKVKEIPKDVVKKVELEPAKVEIKDKPEPEPTPDKSKQVPEPSKIEQDNQDIQVIEPQMKKDRWGDGDVKIVSADLYDKNNKKSRVFRTGDDIVIKIKLKSSLKKSFSKLNVGFTIHSLKNEYVFATNSVIEKIKISDVFSQKEISITIPKIPLLRDTYYLSIGVNGGYDKIIYDYLLNNISFKVLQKTKQEGRLLLETKWKVK